MNQLDRGVVRVLLCYDDPTQEKIAATLGVKKAAVAQSLLRLQQADIIELNRKGQKHIPRLRFFTALEQLEAQIQALRCTLGAGPEAA